MGKADLHIHTTYSWDGTMTPRAVLKAAARAGFDVIAITDHDEVQGSLEARELASHYGIEVITGSEITTAEGHLLALFINERIPSRLSLIETLIRIGNQGGLAIAAHPEARATKSINRTSILAAVNHPEAKLVLAGIEVYNAGLPYRYRNHLNKKLARPFHLAQVGNSDAHGVWAIGSASTEFPGRTAEDLRSALLHCSTTAHGAPGFIALSPITTWGFHTILKQAGWVTSNVQPQLPLVLQRYSPPRSIVH